MRYPDSFRPIAIEAYGACFTQAADTSKVLRKKAAYTHQMILNYDFHRNGRILIIVFGLRERNGRTLLLYQVSGVPTVCSEVRMRTKYAPVFAIALVLGWSAPDFSQTSFGISAEAKTKSRISKKTKKHYRVVRKRTPRKAIAKRPVAPSKPVVVAQLPSPSSSPTLDLPVPPIPPIMIFPPPELQAPTREQQMEKLRLGLMRLAKTYPTPEDHMERLRVGLERLARAMNSRGSEIIAQR